MTVPYFRTNKQRKEYYDSLKNNASATTSTTNASKNNNTLSCNSKLWTPKESKGKYKRCYLVRADKKEKIKKKPRIVLNSRTFRLRTK